MRKSTFADKFRAELARRQRERYTDKVHQFAEKKLADGESVQDVAKFVGALLGCPCCGPQWWRDLAIRSYKEAGQSLPPELAGVN